ncbi:MAG: tyrosine-type recombinase/integrase [Propionibacteriales bacterium]|nr:tyrosine-type recombinase/integrase [Propionibacteriales bacterium]
MPEEQGHLTETHLRGGSVRTPTEYARILARFFAAFPDPSSVQPISVHSFAYGRSPGRADPAASTICVRLAAIGGMYDFARRMGAVDRNPAEGIRRPRPTSGLPRGLGVDDLRRLLAVLPVSRAGRRDRAILLLILLSGLRRSEVFSLTVADIDYTTGDYAVRVKGGHQRRRRVPPPALAVIVEVRAVPVTPSRPSRPVVSTGRLYVFLDSRLSTAALAGLPLEGRLPSVAYTLAIAMPRAERSWSCSPFGCVASGSNRVGAIDPAAQTPRLPHSILRARRANALRCANVSMWARRAREARAARSAGVSTPSGSTSISNLRAVAAWAPPSRRSEPWRLQAVKPPMQPVALGSERPSLTREVKFKGGVQVRSATVKWRSDAISL